MNVLVVVFAVLAVLGGALAWFTAPPPRPRAQEGAVLPGGAVVAFSEGYRVSFYGIERLHPFVLTKSRQVAQHLVAEGLVPRDGFAVTDEVDAALLASVHDAAYLAEISDPRALGEALEVHVPSFLPRSAIERRVLGPFRRQVQGTVVAARAARMHGLGVNLGGGFHHARPAMGHGFCVYGDVAAAVAALRADGFAGRVLIVDTDAHQGDGNHAFFAEDSSVFSLSLHQEGIFPQPRLRGDVDVDLAAGTDDANYLEVLAWALARAPDDAAFVFHVAGADVLADDPLAGLGLGPEGLVARDLAVLRWARARGLPVVHLLAGGYGPSAARAQALSVAALLREVRDHPIARP